MCELVPNKVKCLNATVNGDIDDNNSCALVESTCSVNGRICGVGDDDGHD